MRVTGLILEPVWDDGDPNEEVDEDEGVEDPPADALPDLEVGVGRPQHKTETFMTASIPIGSKPVPISDTNNADGIQ